jgi:hypothetical protein
MFSTTTYWPRYLYTPKRWDVSIGNESAAFSHHTWVDTFVSAAKPFFDSDFLDATLSAIPHLNRPKAPANLTVTDTALLVNGGIVEEVPSNFIRAWVNVFSVYEPHKARRRLITEPRLNDVLLDPGEVNLHPSTMFAAKFFSRRR